MRLAEIVEQFSRKRVVDVYGDFVADGVFSMEIFRVCRAEASCSDFEAPRDELVLVGGANATNKPGRAWGERLLLNGVGMNAAGEALVKYFRALGVDNSRESARCRNWTTPDPKTKVLAPPSGRTQRRSQVLRVSREPNETPCRRRFEGNLIKKLSAKIARGQCFWQFQTTDSSAALRARRCFEEDEKIPVTLDARYGLTRYAGAGSFPQHRMRRNSKLCTILRLQECGGTGTAADARPWLPMKKWARY